MSIDWHCHWLPPDLAEALRARASAPRIVAEPGGERLEVYRESLPVGPELIEIGRRVGFMDRHGVARQVLSLPGLFGIDSLPVDDAAPMVRAFNDALATAIAERPERFAGFAALPLADPAAAVEEFKRALARPGFVGAILPADGFLTRAEADRLAPVLEAADAMAAHLFIHPGPMPGAEPGAAGGAAPRTPKAPRTWTNRSWDGTPWISATSRDSSWNMWPKSSFKMTPWTCSFEDPIVPRVNTLCFALLRAKINLFKMAGRPLFRFVGIEESPSSTGKDAR